MPRYNRTPKLSTDEARRRADSYRVFGKTKFLDAFPIGFGTLPEKIVYNELSRRNIPFLYLNDIELIIPEIEFAEFFQADFIIPSLRIIIEVQGAHWHSMPTTIEADAFKFALYQQTGWQPLAWWDFDILSDIGKLFAAVPALQAASRVTDNLASAEMAVQRRTKTDTSQGIRTMNQRRGQRLQYRKKPVTIKKTKAKNYGSYTTSTK
jgi:hypothetical protein